VCDNSKLNMGNGFVVEATEPLPNWVGWKSVKVRELISFWEMAVVAISTNNAELKRKS